ncbi:MAG: phospholipid carrier-dependent glycosyltransferase [Acidobacteriota bacterium]
MSRARFPAALAAIALFALLGAEVARFSLWTTSDEPAHLAAAREWRHGPGMVSNFEHPVLMKLLAGIFLAREKPAMEIDETRAGRAAIPFLFLGLAVVTGLLGRALAGDAAGLAAAALVAIEPTLRGHGTLVQSDVLVTFFFVAAALALELGARGEKRTMLIASGVLYGFAMASKYSAFPFLAVFALVAMIRLASGSLSLKLKMGAALVVIALATLFLIQFVAFAGTSDDTFRAAIAHEFNGLPQERAALALARVFPKAIAAYGSGLLFVQGVAGPGERFNYFFGEVSGKGNPFYFPVALGVKLTTATVLAFVASLLAAGILLAGKARRRRILAARAWLPAALGGAYLAAACSSNVNIGVRHVLPAVPFLLVSAAAAGRTFLARRPRALRAALLGVVLFAAGESVLRLGREISFGNLLVGGPAGVPAVLSDSNVDWGQEQGQVFRRVRRGDLGSVGIASLIVDESGARAVGIAGQVTTPDAPVDTVFFSRFLWDTASAIEKNTESWPKFVWLRGWLPPLRHGLEARAVSVEPFGDAQFLLRLRAPATAAPSSSPAPTR